MTPTLGVNIDHVATLRQARGGFGPDTVEAAKICQKAGAGSIVMRLREDRRHIQDRDLFRVKEAISIKLNMEMAIAPSVVKVARALRPGQVTLVPEKRKELTTESATPLTDGEILLGKTISALLPTLIAMYVGAAVFMVGIDAVTFHTLGYYYFPNWTIAVLLLILVPVAIVLSIEFSVIVSSRVNDVRSASSFGNLMLFPFLAIYLVSEIGAITLDTTNILIISSILLAIDAALFFVSKATFRREEILTKWK